MEPFSKSCHELFSGWVSNFYMQVFGVFLIKKSAASYIIVTLGMAGKVKHVDEIGLTVILHTHLVFGG